MKHLVCFRVGKETFGVDIFAVREIVRVQEITRVPGAPDHMKGVINLRGRIIPVMDLGQQLGVGPAGTSRTSRILVVQIDKVTVGFLVDAATAVIKVGAEAVEPPPEMLGGVNVEYLQGVAKLEGHLAILLDLRKVVSNGQSAVATSAESLVEMASGARR